MTELTRERVEAWLAREARLPGDIYDLETMIQHRLLAARALIAAWDREAKLSAVVKYIARFGPDEDSQSQCRFALKSIATP